MTNCHDPLPPKSSNPTHKRRQPLIALAGQPNVGKSTVFNLFTGMNQHVGNWPGKTVERKEGQFKHTGKTYTLVDLPGTYSLSANSPEELITREFILTQQPDLVIALVNAASLEHSLYLVAELLALRAPLLVVLNMMDVAEQAGLRIEPQVLEAALGVPVVAFTATHPQNCLQLMELVKKVIQGEVESEPRLPTIRQDHAQVLQVLEQKVVGALPPVYPNDWVAIKLMEGDAEITRRVQSTLSAERWEEIHAILRQHDDALLAIASGRYDWIGRMTRAAVTHPKVGQISRTDRIDKWAAHPVGCTRLRHPS